MPCQLCGADGVNKSTCPFNPKAANPKSSAHNGKPKNGGKGKGMKPKTKIKVKPPTEAKPKTKIKVKPPTEAKPKTKIKVKPPTEEESEGVTESAYATGLKEAKQLFPNNIKKQQEYMADIVALDMPDVVVLAGDPQREHAKKQKSVILGKKTSIKNKCNLCLRAVNMRNLLGNDTSKWASVAAMCDDCHREIGDFYHSKLPGSEQYKTYHKGDLPATVFIKHGATDDYYNGTMYAGAKYWRDAAMMRSLKSAPTAPAAKHK
jgi:hypothetical protein